MPPTTTQVCYLEEDMTSNRCRRRSFHTEVALAQALQGMGVGSAAVAVVKAGICDGVGFILMERADCRYGAFGVVFEGAMHAIERCAFRYL